MADLQLGKAVLELTTDDKGLNKGVNDAETKSNKLVGTFGKTGVAARVMGGIVASSVVGSLSDMARAAAEDEANTAKLQQAVENTGASWGDYSGKIDAAIAKGQQRAFGDTETRDSLTQLATATGSVTAALEMQNVVQDIARGRNISLAAATDIAQKAALGNYGALKKLGIEIDATMTPTQALGELQKHYAGQSETYANTTEAAIARVKDQIGEWKEGIGAALGPAAKFLAVMPGMSKEFVGLGAAAGHVFPLIKAAPGQLLSMLSALNPVTLATKLWTLAQVALNLVMSANPIALIVLGIAALVVAFKIAYDHSEAFRNIVHQLFDWLGNLLKPLGWVWDRVMDLAKAFGLVGDSTSTMKDEASADFEALKTDATASMNATSKGVVDAASGMKKSVVSLLDEMAAKGVGDSNDTKIKSILAAMGMKDGVIRQMEDLASGFAGWSERTRDKAIFDMQYAELETTLRAKGLADGVIEQIMRMASGARAEFENARSAADTNLALMKDNMDGFSGTVTAGTLNVQLFRQNFESIPARKEARLDYYENHIVTYTGGGGGGNVLAAANGWDGMVGPSFGGPQLFLAGEGSSDERVSIGPAGRGSGGDRPIVVQSFVELDVDGRALARASARSDNTQSRRFGYGLG